MAAAGGDGLQRLSCRADQFGRARGLPLQRHQPLAARAVSAWSEGDGDVAADDRAAKSMATQAAHHASVAWPALRRQTPEVGARCGKSARRDLCGRRVVTRVSTAILHGLKRGLHGKKIRYSAS